MCVLQNNKNKYTIVFNCKIVFVSGENYHPRKVSIVILDRNINSLSFINAWTLSGSTESDSFVGITSFSLLFAFYFHHSCVLYPPDVDDQSLVGGLLTLFSKEALRLYMN